MDKDITRYLTLAVVIGPVCLVSWRLDKMLWTATARS